MNGTPLSWTNSPLANAQHSYPCDYTPKREQSQKNSLKRKKRMCWYVCFIAKSNQTPPQKKKNWFSTSKSSSPLQPLAPPPWLGQSDGSILGWQVRLVDENLWFSKHPKIYVFFLPPQNGGRVKLYLMFGTITFMLRKETKCFCWGKPKQFRKCDAYVSTFTPPKHDFLGSKSSFSQLFHPPPNPKKMGVDRKHLELCNKNLQLPKNSTAQLFGKNLPCFGSVPTFRAQGTGSMDHHGPWYTSEPKSPGQVEVGHLPKYGSLSCPCLGNPYNGYIRTPTYWVDDWWPSPISGQNRILSKPELRGILQQGIPSEPIIDFQGDIWFFFQGRLRADTNELKVSTQLKVHSAPTPIISWKHVKISSYLSNFSAFFRCCLRFGWVCAHSAIYDEFFPKETCLLS